VAAVYAAVRAGDGGLHHRGVARSTPRIGLKDAAFGALVAAFPNTGFMGVPLLVALLGPAAAGPVICTVLADLFVTSSLCIALAQLQAQVPGHGRGARGRAAAALRGALSNPLPWAIALGALFCRPPNG
jgi:malonate transporter